MIKILFLSPRLEGGGAQKSLINIVNSLDTEVFNIDLVVCGGQINYHKLIGPNISITNLDKKRVLFAWPGIFKLLHRNSYDLVLTSITQVSVPITILKKMFGFRYLNVIRIPTLPSNRLGEGLKNWILDQVSMKVIKWSDHIIAQTDQMKNEIEQYFKVSNPKISVIPNLVNKKQIIDFGDEFPSGFKESDINIVAVGTLYSVKGFDLLIQAISIVKNRLPNLKLHILGSEGYEKGYKAKLETLVDRLGLSEIVRFYGFISNPYPFIKDANLFVLSSRKEGFPNVVLESLILKTPVVATDCIDFSTIIDPGVNGIIVKSEDVKAIADGILHCLEHQLTFEFSYEVFDYNSWFLKILNGQ